MTTTTQGFNAVEESVTALSSGSMVLVVDDLALGNGGALVMSASKVTAEGMAFIIRHSSGIVCTPLSAERAESLQLPPMVAGIGSHGRPAFSVSVDYKHGMTTGISATQRANTARALAVDDIRPEEFVRPGHVFPIIGCTGGVLNRPCHSEAALDLLRTARLPAVAVIGQLLDDDGSVKPLGSLMAFARRHGLKVVSLKDLIVARRQTERLFERRSTDRVIMEGLDVQVHAYATPSEAWQHTAVVYGDVVDGLDVPCCIQKERPLRDLVSPNTHLKRAMNVFRGQGRGDYILLRTPAITSPETKDEHRGDNTNADKSESHWEECSVGAQVIRDLGIRSVTLLTSQPSPSSHLARLGVTIATCFPFTDA